MATIVHGGAGAMPPIILPPTEISLRRPTPDQRLTPTNILIAAGDAESIKEAINTEGGRRVIEVAESGDDFVRKAGKPNQIYIIGDDVDFQDLAHMLGDQPVWRKLSLIGMVESKAPFEVRSDSDGIKLGKTNPIILVTAMSHLEDSLLQTLHLYNPGQGYGGINGVIEDIEDNILPNTNY